MGLFDNFPYTNFHELNLMWILEALKEIQTTTEQFVAINSLKYADPIQWNIVSQYEKNTIVIDPLTGTAYISVQPVPSGVSLTNTDYWTVVFDLGAFVVRASKNFAVKYEPATTLTATFPSNVNDWLIWGDILYKVISPIVAGDQYVINSNIEHITMEYIIGHLEDLQTVDKSNIVNAINEVVDNIGALTDTIGDLNDLTDVGDPSSIVNAINSKYDKTYVNVKDYGAKGDNTTDDTAAINAAITAAGNNGIVYFPQGRYLTQGHVLTTTTGFVGCGVQSVVVVTTNQPVFDYDVNDLGAIQIRNLWIYRETPATISDTDAVAIRLRDTSNGASLLFSNLICQNHYTAFELLALIAGSTIRDCYALDNTHNGFTIGCSWYIFNCYSYRCGGAGFYVTGQYHQIAGVYFDSCTAYRTKHAGFISDGSNYPVADVMYTSCMAVCNRTGGFSFVGTGNNHTITGCYSEYAGYEDENKTNPNVISNASSIYIYDQTYVTIDNYFEFESAYAGLCVVNSTNVYINNSSMLANKFGILTNHAQNVSIAHCNLNGRSVGEYGIYGSNDQGSNWKVTIDDCNVQDNTVTAIFMNDPEHFRVRNCDGYDPAITAPTLVSGQWFKNDNACDVQVFLTGTVDNLIVDTTGLMAPSQVPAISFILEKGHQVYIEFTGSVYWTWQPYNITRW